MNTRTKSLLYVMLFTALAPLTVLMHCAEAQVELKPFSAPKIIALSQSKKTDIDSVVFYKRKAIYGDLIHGEKDILYHQIL